MCEFTFLVCKTCGQSTTETNIPCDLTLEQCITHTSAVTTSGYCEEHVPVTQFYKPPTGTRITMTSLERSLFSGKPVVIPKGEYYSIEQEDKNPQRPSQSPADHFFCPDIQLPGAISLSRKYVLSSPSTFPLEKRDPTSGTTTHSKSVTIFQSAQLMECEIFEGEGENRSFTLGVSISCRVNYKGPTRAQNIVSEARRTRRQEWERRITEAAESLKELHTLCPKKRGLRAVAHPDCWPPVITEIGAGDTEAHQGPEALKDKPGRHC
ncbi:hypothetical protein EV426DRAFT_700500 [Tirmania nivea]|nr:hypothetical protein EV426DRAFT_700500 [Tirmania nivea]